MKKLRVLHVHTLPIVSGSGINTFLSMDRIDHGRYEAALACRGGGRLEERVRGAGYPFHEIPHFVQPVSLANDLRALAELTALMKRGHFEIVHTHNSKAGYIGRLAARRAGVPVVIHTIHGFSFHAAESPQRRFLFRALERQAAPWADRLVVISRPLKEWGLKEGIGREAQYRVVYSGIDPSAFRRPVDKAALRRALGLSPGDLAVGIVAKLWAGKGHADLFRAFALLGADPRLKLLVVGEGELRPSLERLAEELAVKDRVIFAGFRGDVEAVTQILEISVLPSAFEGMGRVLLEAQAAGVPVVANRVGGVVDVVEDGVTGFLVEAGKIAELSERIKRLAEDPNLRKQMGESGMKRVDERYSADKMVRDLDFIYQEVAHEKGLCS